ncbi:dihydroxyacetone kinase subunit L [Pseudomonas guguanensis]|uniref:dihydroxyacetone kinase subunit L n=1 Tax=Ectopseudomonas guguanensis TaxID=1198456 RepID=UPI00326387A8
MSAITVETLQAAIARANARMLTLEEELNAADSKLGDGDTGVMLARVLARFQETDLSNEADVGAALQTLARAAASATGSSLGTLFATALLTIGKKTKGCETVAWSELSVLLQAALDAMINRGGASLGDKTVLDAIEAVVKATDGLHDANQIAASSQKSVQLALDDFRDQPCKIGRARMFAEKSIGIDDPGMLGFARLVEAVSKSS